MRYICACVCTHMSSCLAFKQQKCDLFVISCTICPVPRMYVCVCTLHLFTFVSSRRTMQTFGWRRVHCWKEKLCHSNRKRSVNQPKPCGANSKLSCNQSGMLLALFSCLVSRFDILSVCLKRKTTQEPTCN